LNDQRIPLLLAEMESLWEAHYWREQGKPKKGKARLLSEADRTSPTRA